MMISNHRIQRPASVFFSAKRWIFASLFAMSGFSFLAHAADPATQSLGEDDWWLPEWVQAKADVIGFYGAPPDDVKGQDLQLVSLRWKDVNPQEGVFDWSELRRALAKGNGVYLRLETSHVVHCPAWLEDKYPDLKQGILRGEKTRDNWEVQTGGTYYPLWHEGFAAEFRRLLRSLQESGLARHENFRFWYIPGAWAWGEFGVEFVEEMRQAGMKPEDFMQWWRRTLDAYVQTVGQEHAGKLMFTGQDHVELCDDDQEWRRIIEIGRASCRERV